MKHFEKKKGTTRKDYGACASAQPQEEISRRTAVSVTRDSAGQVRHDWKLEEVQILLSQPLSDLIFTAQTIHRKYFDPNQIQRSTLVNIKSGGCPEDCAYCPQSAHYATGVSITRLMSVESVCEQALAARAQGASRFCMGAAWRDVKTRDLGKITAIIQAVRELGMETCATLGMLTQVQAQALAAAGLDYYNHNLDTSPEYYAKIISTRDYQQRLTTLQHVRNAGIKVCCGGILGMGESQTDRARMLQVLANLPQHPESVPVNQLVAVAGTPLAKKKTAAIDSFDFVRTVATARIMMPQAWIRLSAGRDAMNDEMQALCFLAGANSIFYGEELLTTANVATARDNLLFQRLGISAVAAKSTPSHS